MTSHHEASDAHNYRAPLNPAFVRRVMEQRQRETRKMEMLAEAESRRRYEEESRVRAELIAAQRKEAQAFKATEAYRVIIVSEAGEGKQSARSIIDRVASVFGVSYGEIVGQRRNRHVVAARHAAIQAVVEARPDMTLPMVGRIFNKDHTTIMHALGKKKRAASKQEGQPR